MTANDFRVLASEYGRYNLSSYRTLAKYFNAAADEIDRLTAELAEAREHIAMLVGNREDYR